MTDQQLQLALVRMLPEKISHREWESFGSDGTALNHSFFWKDKTNTCDCLVIATEWIHVCALIEQRLSEQEQNHYTTRLIFDRIGPDNTNLVVWEALTASWQQRAEALCKVKGIAI